MYTNFNYITSDCVLVDDSGIVSSPGWDGVVDYAKNINICWFVEAPVEQVFI